MYLSGNILVNINGVDIPSVTSIEIQSDCMQLGTTCTITFPLNVRMPNKGQYIIDSLYYPFKSGQSIVIYASYTGLPTITVFQGYIWDLILGTPIKMYCMDNIYLLRQTAITVNGGQTQTGTNESGTSIYTATQRNLSWFLNKTLDGTGITLNANNLDIDNITGAYFNMSPAAIIENIREQLKYLVFTLIDNELVVNIAKYTNPNVVKIQSDINLEDDTLQQPETSYQLFKISIWCIDKQGRKVNYIVGNTNGILHEIYLYNLGVLSKSDAKEYGQKALDNLIKGHFTGELKTLLYPDIKIFDKIVYSNVRYPEKNGSYVCRATKLSISEHGIKRTSTLAWLEN